MTTLKIRPASLKHPSELITLADTKKLGMNLLEPQLERQRLLWAMFPAPNGSVFNTCLLYTSPSPRD